VWSKGGGRLSAGEDRRSPSPSRMSRRFVARPARVASPDGRRRAVRTRASETRRIRSGRPATFRSFSSVAPTSAIDVGRPELKQDIAPYAPLRLVRSGRVDARKLRARPAPRRRRSRRRSSLPSGDLLRSGELIPSGLLDRGG